MKWNIFGTKKKNIPEKKSFNIGSVRKSMINKLTARWAIIDEKPDMIEENKSQIICSVSVSEDLTESTKTQSNADVETSSDKTLCKLLEEGEILSALEVTQNKYFSNNEITFVAALPFLACGFTLTGPCFSMAKTIDKTIDKTVEEGYWDDNSSSFSESDYIPQVINCYSMPGINNQDASSIELISVTTKGGTNRKRFEI